MEPMMLAPTGTSWQVQQSNGTCSRWLSTKEVDIQCEAAAFHS